jgi:hypothetical protein
VGGQRLRCYGGPSSDAGASGGLIRPRGYGLHGGECHAGERYRFDLIAGSLGESEADGAARGGAKAGEERQSSHVLNIVSHALGFDVSFNALYSQVYTPIMIKLYSIYE